MSHEPPNAFPTPDQCTRAEDAAKPWLRRPRRNMYPRRPAAWHTGNHTLRLPNDAAGRRCDMLRRGRRSHPRHSLSTASFRLSASHSPLTAEFSH